MAEKKARDWVELRWEACLILCPLLFLAGFVDAVAGGGGLISLPAYLFVGIPVHLAAGTNKVVNGIGTSVAAANYLRGGKVRLREAAWAAAGALAGAAAGARLALWCPERVLRGCLLAVLLVVAVILAVKKDFGREDRPRREWTLRQRTLWSLAIGAVIGMYDGLVGPGTGTFMLMTFSWGWTC